MKMEMEVIIKKALVFAGLFAFVYAVFIRIAMLPSILIVIFTLKPLEQFLVNITSRFFIQKRYDYKELLKTFTTQVLTVLDLAQLVHLTVDKLVDIIKLDSCGILLFDEYKREFSVVASCNIKGSNTISIGYGTISQFLTKKREFLLRTELAEAGEDLNAQLLIPLALHNDVIGLLALGKKKSGSPYTQDDFDILLPLAKTLAITISNARLFEDLTRTRANIAQKEKMATIGTLAAGIAHEIRNPLTTIRTFADYLPERYIDRYFIDKFNRLIPQEVDRIDNIAQSLLEFSGNEELTKEEEVDLVNAIRVVLSLLEPQYRFSDVAIDFAVKDKATILANKRQIQDAFFNIMKYIVSETPKNSCISINIEEGVRGPKVSIKDKGLEIAGYILKELFEPVSKLYREKRGFGFDLFIAKQLLEKNNGAFAISLDKETGTEFIIDFNPALPAA